MSSRRSSYNPRAKYSERVQLALSNLVAAGYTRFTVHLLLDLMKLQRFGPLGKYVLGRTTTILRQEIDNGKIALIDDKKNFQVYTFTHVGIERYSKYTHGSQRLSRPSIVPDYLSKPSSCCKNVHTPSTVTPTTAQDLHAAIVSLAPVTEILRDRFTNLREQPTDTAGDSVSWPLAFEEFASHLSVTVEHFLRVKEVLSQVERTIHICSSTSPNAVVDLDIFRASSLDNLSHRFASFVSSAEIEKQQICIIREAVSSCAPERLDLIKARAKLRAKAGAACEDMFEDTGKQQGLNGAIDPLISDGNFSTL